VVCKFASLERDPVRGLFVLAPTPGPFIKGEVLSNSRSGVPFSPIDFTRLTDGGWAADPDEVE
jgi:hypothetical protein